MNVNAKVVNGSGSNVPAGKFTAASIAALVFVIVALIAIGPVPAKADIYRGCTGVFQLGVVSGTGKLNSNTSKQIDAFEGRGQCKNKLQANTCRSRAKDNIFRCANDLWAVRWSLIGDPKDSHPDGGLPDSCLGRATGAKSVGPFKENPFGQFFDIKYTMEYTACCELQPEAKTLQLSLSVSSVGDKGCGNDKSPYGSYRELRTLENNYQVNCKTLRDQGMCAKRTN